MPEKILIVDDDAETLRLIGMMLERQGFVVASLNNGIQAVEIARSEKPDLIVLDVMMPEVDGYEVTRLIRNEPSLMDVPILMFTAKSQVNDKVVGYEAGVDDYLTKPVHPAELVAHIRALLIPRESSPCSGCSCRAKRFRTGHCQPARWNGSVYPGNQPGSCSGKKHPQ